jgi:hypothetical protein
MEYEYIKGCSSGKVKMEKYCICTLREIEKRYTMRDFVNLYSEDPNEFKKRLVRDVVPVCIDLIEEFNN